MLKYLVTIALFGALASAPALAQADIIKQAPITLSGTDFKSTNGIIGSAPGALGSITAGIFAQSSGNTAPIIGGSGQAQSIVGTFPPSVLQILSGSAASPQTAAGPAVQINNYTNIPYSLCGNNSNAVACSAALSVNSTSGPNTTMVTAGIQVAAQGTSSSTGSPIPPFGNQSPDVFGISSKGLKTGGIGIAGGGYFVGHRTVDTVFAEGAEISSWNQTNTNCPVSYVTASWCDGVLLSARGNPGTLNSSALHTHTDGSAKWAEGITFNQGSIATFTFNDQSSSTRSIVVSGSHTGGALIINQGAGFVGLNLFSPSALIHIGNSISAPAWATSGIVLRQDAMTLTDTTTSGTLGNVYGSSIAGPVLAASSAATYTNAATLSIGAPTAGTNVTVTNRYALSVAGDARMLGGGLQFTGAISLPSYANTGAMIRQSGATITDTTSTGTIDNNYVNVFGASTLAASSAVTYTAAASLYVAPPVAGTNVTIGLPIAARFGGRIRVDGPAQIGPGAPLTLDDGEMGFSISASGTAPGIGGGKLAFQCGTTAGTAKLVAYAGGFNTPTVVFDNIGGSVFGC